MDNKNAKNLFIVGSPKGVENIELFSQGAYETQNLKTRT